jgi:hypothetical protein
MSSKVLTRPSDTKNENDVARTIEKAWGCSVDRSGYFDAWDFYGYKDRRLVFIAELKVRTNASSTYPTVFLSVHKWSRLVAAAAGLGVQGLFIVKFSDKLMYARVRDIDARNHTIAGRTDRPGVANDQEPIIEVPVNEMKQIGGAE